MTAFRPARWILGLALLLAFSLPARAGGIDALVQDTQRQATGANAMGMAWWIPTEFWLLAMEQGNGGVLSATEREQLKASMDPFTVLVVFDGAMGPLGGATFRSPEEVAKMTRLVDPSGKTWEPIAESRLSPDLRNILTVMRPMFASILGPVGQNMAFVVFEGEAPKGGRLIDPRSDGRFTVKVGTTDYHWRLPLGSLLPEQSCSKCSETMYGAWKYCPWDGTTLRE